MQINGYHAAMVLNPYSSGIDFSRQNMTYVDVRFWRLKSIPALHMQEQNYF